MESLKIVGVCVLGAVLYGIVHDLVTANICVEYFSVFHPDIFHTDSPWLLALGWGVIATWWMGLFLGALIAVAFRNGSLPQLSWRDLTKPILFVFTGSYMAAIGGGLIGRYAVGRIPDWVLDQVPRVADAHLSPAKQAAFTCDLFAHNASYFASAIGALILCAWAIRKRMKMPRPLIAGQRPI